MTYHHHQHHHYHHEADLLPPGDAPGRVLLVVPLKVSQVGGEDLPPLVELLGGGVLLSVSLSEVEESLLRGQGYSEDGCEDQQ